MSLSAADLVTFRNAINAETDAGVVAARTAGNDTAIANFYAQPSSPQVLLWRPAVTIDELKAAVVWTEFLALTVARQNAWFALTQGVAVDATNTNIRTGFSSVFGASSTLTNLTAIAQRNATKLEALFATSSVSTQFGYTATPSDVAAARAN